MIALLRLAAEVCLGVGSLGLLYTLVLAGAAAVARTRARTRTRTDVISPRVAVLVPAHDEAAVIGALLEDLRGQTRPPALVLVAADRCRDGTERVAGEGGAEVLRLPGPEGGKGYALARGLQHLRDREWDTALVVDADCRLDRGFLAAATAGPGEVVQARVALRAGPSRRGLVYDYLSRIENDVLHGGRAVLGLPGFLRGTGMFLGRDAIRRCPWESTGLTEDRTQGFRFLRAGVPVRHDPALEIATRPPERAEETWNQRRRWTSVGLLSHGAASLTTAAAATRHFGPRVWELPLAVLADARSQWILLLVLGTLLAAVAGGPVVGGVVLLVVAAAAAVAAGLSWYGSRFLLVVVQAPAGAAVALASGALSLLGIRPGGWRKGRPG